MAKKVVDVKTGRKVTFFNEYNLGESLICPKCGRPLKEYDIKSLEENGKRNCPKCGSRLKK